LPGLRDLGEFVGAGELTGLGIQLEHRGAESAGNPAAARYKTWGWVRPRLVNGHAVWPVEWSNEYDAWIPLDRKKNRGRE